MNKAFDQRLGALSANSDPAVGAGFRGIEKESLRVDADGNLAQTPHPAGLGSALTNRFITSHASNSGRLVSSSPLVKLSMSSSLDEGGGAAGFRGGLHMPPRRVSDASVESGGGNSGREECLMESSDCESVDSVEPGAGATVIGATTTVPGHGQEEKQETAPELTHMTS